MPRVTVGIEGIDVAATLRPVALMPSDPTVRLFPGTFLRATITPYGPASLRVDWVPLGAAPGPSVIRSALAVAAGPGAQWVLARVPGLLGALDDPAGFRPESDPLQDLWRRNPGLRVGRTSTLWHDLAWFIVQQRVSGRDASDQWRRLVLGLGATAPPLPDAAGDSPELPGGGTPGHPGEIRPSARMDALPLMTPPDPAVVARLPYYSLHRFGIERQRAETLIRAARAALRTQLRVDEPSNTVLEALASVRGIGPWTATCLAATTWGEPDSAILGDYGLPSAIAWALAGQREADDARMLELLEPYRPHRLRVVRLVQAAGLFPPRRHHRGEPTDIRFR